MDIGYIASRPRLLRNIVLSALAIAAAATALAIAFYALEKGALLDSENEHLILVAKSVSRRIDADLHSEISSPQDRFTDQYDSIAGMLTRVLADDEYVSDIYTLRESGGKLVYVVDTPSDLDRDGVIEGDAERRQEIGRNATHVQADVARRALSGETAASRGVREDEKGIWLTACAPLARYDGSIDGTVCVQSEESSLWRKIVRSAMISFGSFALMSLAIIFMAASLIVMRERLADAREDVSRGQEMVELFRAAFEHSSLIAVQALNREGRITLWNRACEELFGFSSAEAEDQSAVDLIFGEEQRSSFERMLEQIWATKLTLPSVEMELKRKDESKATVLLQLIPIMHGGAVSEALLIAIDVSQGHEAMKKLEGKVTELKNLQESLLAREGRMIELKNEINSLLENQGQKPKYVT